MNPLQRVHDKEADAVISGISFSLPQIAVPEIKNMAG